MDETTLAYLAGVFDEKGWIGFARYRLKSGGVGHTLVLELELADEEVVRCFASAFGGVVHKSERARRREEKWSPTWRCRFTFRRARQTYLLLEKYLRKKRLSVDERRAAGIVMPPPPLAAIALLALGAL